MIAIVRKQWFENERLAFPLAQIQLALVDQPPRGRWLNELMRRRSFWIAFFAFWAIQVGLILNGIEGIKRLETWSAPLLLAGGAALLVWACWRAGGLGRVLDASNALRKQHNGFWSIFPGALTASVGYWATLSLNMPDFTRFGRSQKEQAFGQMVALPTTMTVFAGMGVVITSATKSPALTA